MEAVIKPVSEVQPGKEFTLIPVSTDTRHGDSFLMIEVKTSERDHTIKIVVAERYHADPKKRKTIHLNADREAKLVIPNY